MRLVPECTRASAKLIGEQLHQLALSNESTVRLDEVRCVGDFGLRLVHEGHILELHRIAAS